MKTLVFGHKGWIASYMLPCLEARGFIVLTPPDELRADDISAVKEHMLITKPDRVLSLIGRTHGEGFTTIDYLEQPGKLTENIRDNLFSPLALAETCAELGIHFTYMGTGCIFCSENPEETTPYTENDNPDFFGSSYSTVKGYTDRLIRHAYNETSLNVRIRMPITADRSQRNFITKIANYKKVCSIANSMTVLPSLLPILCDMIWNNTTGTINLVNPGYITHNQILEMYKQYVDPWFVWENFTIEEQEKILLSKRSNNVLDNTKLCNMYPDVPDIKTAVENVLKEMALCTSQNGSL